MRVLIASAAALTFAAAAAAALALHSPVRSPQVVRTAEAAAPQDAVPGLVWRSGSVTLRLTDRPCPNEDLTRTLEVEGVTQALAYEVTQAKESRRTIGCWSKDVGGDVVTMEPGRDVGSIPLAWFRADAGS